MLQQRPSLLRSIMMWSTSVAVRSILAFLYIILLARILTLEDFAAWGIIISIGNSLAIISRLPGFWAPRIREHGAPVSVAWSTGFMGSLAAAFLVGLLVSISSNYISYLLNIKTNYIVYSTPVISLFILYTYSQLFNQSFRPEREPIALIVFELSRIISFLIMVIVFGSEQYLFYSAVLSHGIGMIAYVIYVGKYIGIVKPRFDLLLDWIRKWKPPVMEGLAITLVSLIRPAVSAIVGPEPVAYLNIGFSISRIVSQILLGVSWNVYSRLIDKPNSIDVGKTVSGLLVLAGLIIVSLFGFAEYMTLVFGKEYANVELILMVMAVRSSILAVGVAYARAMQAYNDYGLISKTSRVLLVTQASSLGLGSVAAMFGSGPLEQALYVSIGLTVPAIIYTFKMITIARTLGFTMPSKREAIAVMLGLVGGLIAWLLWAPLALIAYIVIVILLSMFVRIIIVRIIRGILRLLH